MEEVYKYLATAGVAGAVLAYHLWRLEPRLRAIEEAIARQGRIDLLRLAGSPLVAPELKEAARSIIQEIDATRKRDTTNP